MDQDAFLRSLPPNDRLCHAAVRAGEREARLALEAGADPNFIEGLGGCSPLLLACLSKNWEVARLLLPLSDARLASRHGVTPLMEIACSGSIKAQTLGPEFLARSDPLTRCSEGRSALMRAASADACWAIRMLLPVSDAFAVDAWGKSASDVAQSPEARALIQAAELSALTRGALSARAGSRL